MTSGKYSVRIVLDFASYDGAIDLLPEALLCCLKPCFPPAIFITRKGKIWKHTSQNPCLLSIWMTCWSSPEKHVFYALMVLICLFKKSYLLKQKRECEFHVNTVFPGLLSRVEWLWWTQRKSEQWRNGQYSRTVRSSSTYWGLPMFIDDLSGTTVRLPLISPDSLPLMWSFVGHQRQTKLLSN